LKKIIIGLILPLVTLIVPRFVQAQSFNVFNPEVKQGEVLIIKIAPQWLPPVVSNPAISVFGQKYLPNQNGEIFIGIGADFKPGKYIVTLVEFGNGSRLSFDYNEVEIIRENFPRTIINRSRIIVPTIRRRKEVAEIAVAYRRGDHNHRYFRDNFVDPLDNIIITDVFGRERVYNNGQSRHGGVDLRASIGTKVMAINNGIVVLVGRSFSLEGNFIIIDHGSGIFSVYLHLSEIRVIKGDQIKAGQIIGLSGDTGSAVGPHLHFAVKIRGVNVSPLYFLKISNDYLR
jgi:murein DD-endopeptidase MepM/ murein hydrolase activator NlpD